MLSIKGNKRSLGFNILSAKKAQNFCKLFFIVVLLIMWLEKRLNWRIGQLVIITTEN